MIANIKEAFAQDPDLPVVALNSFLEENAFQALVELCDGVWKKECIPDQYSYAVKELPPFDAVRAFVQEVTGQEPLSMPSRRFAHRDFTLLHDEVMPEPGVLALFFLEDWNEDWGGSLVFMKEGEMLGRVTPMKNTLLIVERKENVQEFVQYINHKAKGYVTMLAI